MLGVPSKIRFPCKYPEDTSDVYREKTIVLQGQVTLLTIYRCMQTPTVDWVHDSMETRTSVLRPSASGEPLTPIMQPHENYYYLLGRRKHLECSSD